MTLQIRWTLLTFLSLIAPLFALFFGAAELRVLAVAKCLAFNCPSEIDKLIFWDIRAPRIAIGFLVGAGLAVAGATLQNVTRNSLSDPYLFGVVAGAGLGASVAIVVADTALYKSATDFAPFLKSLSALSLPASAFLGSLLAIALVHILLISTLGRKTELLILAGVAVSFMLSALSQLLLFMAEPFAANQVIFWLMGSLARAEANYIWILAPTLLLSTGILVLFGPKIDALMLGDQQAQALGVNAQRIRTLCMIICAALTAAIVAYCGGIGFVGLMIPHIVRHWLGVTSRNLVFGCVLLGGGFLVLTDILARCAIEGQELPIGILTSAIGSLFFLFAVRQNRP